MIHIIGHSCPFLLFFFKKSTVLFLSSVLSLYNTVSFAKIMLSQGCDIINPSNTEIFSLANRPIVGVFFRRPPNAKYYRKEKYRFLSAFKGECGESAQSTDASSSSSELKCINILQKGETPLSPYMLSATALCETQLDAVSLLLYR